MKTTILILLCYALVVQAQFAYYPLNGNANDEGPNALDGSGGDVTWVEDADGNPHSAARFSGGAPIVMPESDVFNLYDSMSLSARIRPEVTHPAGKMGVLGKGDSALRNYALFIAPNGRLQWSVDGVSEMLFSSAVLEVDVWVDVCLVYRINHSMAIYINGELDTLTTATGFPVASSQQFALGCQGSGSCFNLSEPYVGALDEVRLFNRALTAAQVHEIHQPGGLLAYYPVAGNADDAGPLGLHCITDGATLVTGPYGEPQGAYSFSGGAHLRLADSDADTLLSMSHSMSLLSWIRPLNVTPPQKMSILGKGNPAHRNYGAYVQPDGRLRFVIDNVGTLNSRSALAAGEWVHVGFVYDVDSHMALYIDGVLDTLMVASGLPEPTATLSAIGCQGVGQCLNLSVPFEGEIDEIRLYNAPLSEQDIMQIVEPGGLVAHYPFSGNSLDVSGNELHCVLEGGTFATGRFGDEQAAYVVGGTDYCRLDGSVTQDHLLDFEGSMTLSVWIRPDMVTPGMKMAILGKGDSALRNYGLFITPDSRVRLVIDTQEASDYPPVLESASQLLPGEWVQVTAVYRKDQIVALYLNGELDNSNVAAGDPVLSPVGLAIGCGGDGACYSQSVPFEGFIDDVRLYDRAFTQCQARELYDPAGPLAYYPVHGNASDLSGNAFHCDTDGAQLATGYAGTPDGAYEFGGGDVLFLSDASQNDAFNMTGSCTFSAYIRPYLVTPAQKMAFLGKGDSVVRNMGFFIDTNGALRFVMDTDTIVSNPPVITGNQVLIEDEWVFVSAVYKKNDYVALYVDGVLDALSPAEGTPISSETGFTIGCGGLGACSSISVPFEGRIDEITIHDRALSQEEILALKRMYDPIHLDIRFANGQLLLEWEDHPAHSAYLVQGRKDASEEWQTEATMTTHSIVRPVDSGMRQYRVIGCGN